MKCVIDCAFDASKLLRSVAKKRQEHFGIICVDTGREVLSKKVLFIGSECNAIVNPKILFWEACKRQASGIIVFHNHPSGDTSPSQEDMETTKRLLDACDIVGVQMLDHIIVGKYGYFSFMEHDLIDQKNGKLKVAEGV